MAAFSVREAERKPVVLRSRTSYAETTYEQVFAGPRVKSGMGGADSHTKSMTRDVCCAYVESNTHAAPISLIFPLIVG